MTPQTEMRLEIGLAQNIARRALIFWGAMMLLCTYTQYILLPMLQTSVLLSVLLNCRVRSLSMYLLGSRIREAFQERKEFPKLTHPGSL